MIFVLSYASRSAQFQTTGGGVAAMDENGTELERFGSADAIMCDDLSASR